MTLDPDFWTEPEEIKPQGKVTWVREDGTEIDPDTGEVVNGEQPGPETILAEAMLESVRPTGMKFHSNQEAVAWYKLETACMFGATPVEWGDWIENRCWCARQFKMSYQKLMAAIKNEDKFREWRRKYEQR